MLDYLVVGLGLAGISLCERLEKAGKTYHVFSDNSQQASLVAGGLYNPVILKRFSLAWKADIQMPIAMPFYEKLEQKLQVKLDYKMRVLRKFASIEEQNLWFEASDNPRLCSFLSTTIVKNQNNQLDAPFGFGEVLQTGRIDTNTLLTNYKAYLTKQDKIAIQKFDFNELQLNTNCVSYKGVSAKQIVFCEGYGLKSNPYFNYLPLNGTKGELLKITAPDLKENSVIKSSAFVIPLENNEYLLGATYKWKDKTNTPTQESKEELIEKASSFLKTKYEVTGHQAGIRPTVADRRPLVGQHPEHQQLYVLNGFGSRGVLIGPYASEQLVNLIEEGKALDVDMNINRFRKRYKA